MAVSWDDASRSLLQAWRASLSPLTVDIVGDFAGKELFAIHGESLIAHCLPAARVDYNYGFQLLHAVHAVETFLSKLKSSGCNFHVVWFDDGKDLCIPYGTAAEHGYKYMLTRAVLMQHFARVSRQSGQPQSQSTMSYRFDSPECDSFRRYLASNPQYFFLCSDGRATHSEDHPTTLAHLSIGYRMASNGYCVAFIDEIRFNSSKVYVPIVTPAERMTPLELRSIARISCSPRAKFRAKLDIPTHIVCQYGILTSLSSRETITLRALASILDSGTPDVKKKSVACILVQLVFLRHLPLSQRSFEQSGPLDEDCIVFLEEFCQSAEEVVDEEINKVATTRWDVFDLIDGRLYFKICSVASDMQLPDDFSRELSNLAGFLLILSGVDITHLLPGRLSDAEPPIQRSDRRSEKPNQPRSAVLPFSHPVIDQYLQQVQLETEDDAEPPYSRIFQELTHWHNAKKSVDPKHTVKPPGFFARRRNQWFMADTIYYSASLTGATGKNISPESIVVRKPGKSSDGDQPDWKAALRQQSSARSKKQQASKNIPKNGPQAGTRKAIEAAEATQTAKKEEKSLAAVRSWQDRLVEFQNERSLIRRFLKVDGYLSSLSATHSETVGAEVSLYLCCILTSCRREKNLGNASDIEAMLWSKVRETSGFPLTREIASSLVPLLARLDLPHTFGSISSLPRRKLPFTMPSMEWKPMSSSGAVDFQLDFCGPYLERSFESAPDSRVPFEPDAWQRKVLDAIDADKSLFVVAPTSAGKTFISFYAMKKILQSNDDDVIVYVAPTKALVNQIAAEVQARFSKSYHNHDGRSVWAIHTRDYRVNNPQGCQVLVTVPHILQIMLMAPSNAKTPTSWSRRVKRIIFDEVHCIGQSEDGVIWEQLLLLAPCPIIALSATVGNPLEFKEWLEGTQKVKGFEFEMVVHRSRYSDLRKYIYDMPPSRDFKGLGSVERFPFPGLESDAPISNRFAFIHPVGALIGRNPDTLNDANLEPRDCLNLWKCMKKHENQRFKLSESAEPRNFLSSPAKKSDVVLWEARLKEELIRWMIDPESPFDAVREELRGEHYTELEPAQTNNKNEQKELGHIQRLKSGVPNKTIFALALDLRACGALPAIVFNYDRVGCEIMLVTLLKSLASEEAKYKEESPEWKKKIKGFEDWKKVQTKMKAKTETLGLDKDMGKADVARELASREKSPWESFDPHDPLSQFSFANSTKISKEELEERLNTLKFHNIRPELMQALRRGLGVHHAGMNRQYRQVVEVLFRRGYLTIVVATGTLALGLNMPCKTVVFTGDSVFLTALNYRQASGRAGRRGFDVLGNVVFHGIPPKRALEIMSARLPDLRGQFPTSVTLVLRLLGLLHGTDNSEYASNAAKSLLTQTRLYLGGPASQMSVAHHLRFSIDYLRRQHLLSKDGVPLNFSGLIGHLYFTENAVFAFHSLLKGGYFHELCSDISDLAKQPDIILEILLVLSHIFCRIPCHRYQDASWLQGVVYRSPSLVILPDLPETPARILKEHNQETLSIFRDYVNTFSSQHLNGTPDTRLPFTDHTVEPEANKPSEPNESRDMRHMLPSLNETVVRSPFAALSGFTDDFETISELCNSARAGVFLEESAIPYIPMAPHETNGVPWNAYLYDFFKHGDMSALVRDNGIKGGDVWFRLKDFSLILATIVTSLTNFLNPNIVSDDAAMIDVQDAGDVMEESAGIVGKDEGWDVVDNVPEVPVNETVASKQKGKRKVVVDSWDAETDSEPEEGTKGDASQLGTRQTQQSGRTGAIPTTPIWTQDEKSLVKVYKAFATLHEQFDEKFKKVWA
ncbi:P-loop containing nucleoside triphosphate hydrolase protein [Hypoxylon sp. FL1150]|nr:P-loop containing nucleoside triphosphate hydrolase protein [Hypoxylon sp. FL1150]